MLAGNASADPFALVLANSQSAPEVADPASENARESVGEPTTEGEIDAADLSRLGNRLASIALAYEAFHDPSNLDAEGKLLVDYTSPRGLIPNPADRAQSLDRVYRALALIDDTRALRYPEGEACARVHRRALLRSSDGLFADPKTGELSPWLRAELKRSKAGDAPAGLIAASAREWTALGYLKSLAEARALSLQLGDGKILGSSRAAAFCRRAKIYEELAAAQTALKWNDPDLAAQTKAVVEVRWGKEKGTGTVILLDGKPVALVSSRFTENAYETPDLFTKSGKRLSASYLRRGPAFSLLAVSSSPDFESLTLPENPEKGEYVAYAVGHPIQGGPWSVTRGLARPEGALIRTDAAIDGAQAGGPLFDAQGRLTGIVADQGLAYDLAAIKNWLTNANGVLPEIAAAAEFGTGTLLTASSAAIPEGNAVPIEASIVCKDVRGCEWPPPPSSLPPGVPNLGIDHSAPYTGPRLWSMLGNLFKSAPKKTYEIPDNRPSSAPAAVHQVAPEPPKPPPDPLRPNSLKLSVSRTTLAQGEEFEAVATVAFAGKDGSIAGRRVTFTGVPGGKIDCPTAKTDSSGVARTTCSALEGGRDATLDALQDETRRRLGMKTPGRVRRKVVKGDKIGALKEKEADAMGALDIEEEKHPDLGNAGSDTPGIDKPIPEEEVTELEIKGDRVTLGAAFERFNDDIAIAILERPCPADHIVILETILPGGTNHNGPITIRCHDNKVGNPKTGGSYKSDNAEEQPEAKPDGDSEAQPPNKPEVLPDDKRNPAQDKRLTADDIRLLEENDVDVHDRKGHGGGKYDLFKDREGNVYQKPRDGSGPGEPLGINLNEFRR
jgi:hypothetical protein